ncbi:tryptophan--tRNA ligase [Candidatus Woesearchaeota archaeon]|nr:MAG: tryptophan--tRNA ligase [Candidatus Woesearchaeota archaeon]
MASIIDPWGSSLPEDYEKIVREFGLETFDARLFPEPNKLMRRGVVFAGRDLKRIADCIKEKKPFYALTGIMPSNDRIHLGTKMIIENLRYFQEHGAQTYILVADLEAAAARGVALEEARQRALDFFIPAYIALGLDPKKTLFYFQSENMDVIRIGFQASKKITANEFRAIYGTNDPGRIVSAVTQIGDILYPQLGERQPGIIPVGIDQDPHIRLTRDFVNRTRRLRFFPPSSLYVRYTPSLDGGLKMSKSKPEGCIMLPEDVKTAVKRIKRAKTGGRDTVEEHRRLGAIIEQDMVFELLKQHLIDDDAELQRIHDEYKAGRMLSGELKEIACERMRAFLELFDKRLAAARVLVKKGGLNFVRYKKAAGLEESKR